MKKLMIAIAVAAAVFGVYARGCGGGGRGPGGGHGPGGGFGHGGGHCRPCGPGWGHRPPHHGHGGYWGHGGRYFWPGFVGGVVGGLAYSSLTSPYYSSPYYGGSVIVQQPTVVQSSPVVVQSSPVVVSAPVQQTQSVWVEGQYVNQVQSDGTVVRVWSPGHYEQRLVQ